MVKATKTTKKAAAPKKTVAKKTATVSKATKGKKGAATKKTDTPKRRTYHDTLVIFYGGMLKPGRVCVTLLSGSTKKDDVMEHVFNDFSGYYGDKIIGRFVKCENGETALASFQAKCAESLVEGTDFAYVLSVTDAIKYAKEAADVDQASQFKLENFVAEEGGSDESGEGDEGSEESGEEESGESEVDEEDEENEESEEDEESEEAPPKKKAAPKKKAGAKANKARR